MRRIRLTRGMEALIDDDDFAWASQFNWHAQEGYRTFYAAREISLPNGKPTAQRMHRAILERHGHKIDGLEVDHRNHDGLDNRKENLRAGTRAANQGNQTRHDGNYIGVTLHPKGRWMAKIQVKGTETHIGCYDTALEAALARDQYIVDHGIEGYTLNFSEVFANGR